MIKCSLIKSYLKSKNDGLLPEIIDSLYSHYNNVFKDEIDREDLVQDAVIMYYEKLLSDKITESNYSFYIWSITGTIRHRVQSYENKKDKLGKSLSLYEPLSIYSTYSGERGYLDNLEDPLVVKDIFKLLYEVLTDRQYAILSKVCISEEWTVPEASKVYGVTRKRIYDIISTARKICNEYFIKEGYLNEN